MDKPRILFVDLETSPALGYSWQKWDTNIIEFTQHWHLLCFGVKWLGEKTKVHALPDYRGYSKDRADDRRLTKELFRYFNQADIICAHNAVQFDIKRAHARFLVHDLGVPKPYRVVDTLQLARRYFGFMSNKLDDLGEQLGLGRKVKHEGFDMWKGCMAGDKASWTMMKKYNKQDVDLLEKLYLKLRPWARNHPNVSVWRKGESCRVCQSTNLRNDGFYYTNTMKYHDYTCRDCGTWGHSTHGERAAFTR